MCASVCVRITTLGPRAHRTSEGHPTLGEETATVKTCIVPGAVTHSSSVSSARFYPDCRKKHDENKSQCNEPAEISPRVLTLGVGSQTCVADEIVMAIPCRFVSGSR